MKKDCALFIQQRAGKSGAPVALSRILRHEGIQKYNPILLAGSKGWLTDQCDALKIPYIIESFPSSRSLGGLLWKNRSFVKKVIARLDASNLSPRVAIGNDHLEGILTREFGKALRLPTILILRSSGMTRKIFYKYRCHLASRRYSVSDRLAQLAEIWAPLSPTQILYDGIYETDFFPVRPIASSFPLKIMIAGNESPNKGWQDVVNAIDELEVDSQFPALQLDFTGNPPQNIAQSLSKKRRAQFNFIGKVENFLERARTYDLVIHPSRMETFGLAMVEILAAGAPLLCARVGIIEKIQNNEHFLFQPDNPHNLADRLRYLWKHWTEIDFNLEACREKIRNEFMMNRVISPLLNNIESIFLQTGRT